jgi:hypothetical protein
MPEPISDKSVGLSDLAHDVFAFVIEFPADEVPLFPEQVEKVLASDTLKKKLQSTLLAYALEKTKKGQVFSPSDANLGVAILNGARSAAGDQLLEEIKKGVPAQRVARAFKDFTNALQHTPMGIWVDKEKHWLIVVGVVLAVGGAAALFYTRTDSSIVNLPISQIKGKAIPLWSPGNFTLSGGLLEFQPGQRKLGLEIIGEQKWERLTVKMNLGVVGSDPVAKQGDGHAFVASRDFRSPQMKYSLGIELRIKSDTLPNPFILGLHASVSDNKFSGGDLSAAMKFQDVNFGLKAQTDTKSYAGLFTVSGSF